MGGGLKGTMGNDGLVSCHSLWSLACRERDKVAAGEEEKRAGVMWISSVLLRHKVQLTYSCTLIVCIFRYGEIVERTRCVAFSVASSWPADHSSRTEQSR